MIHLSCGTGRPLGARLFKSRFKGKMECHCLLFEDEGNLVLVDAGLSRKEMESPRSLGWFAKGLGLQRAPELAAYEQIRGLNLDPGRVTDVVLTHLDLDHAGGLVDFPDARVHVPAKELEAATQRRTFAERLRYRPEQWEPLRWVPHEVPGEFDLSTPLAVLKTGPWELSYLSLPGHTRGHCGVLARSDRDLVLHCGDAYYDRSELGNRGSFLFRRFKRGVDVSLTDADHTRKQLQSLATQSPELTLFCSHDPEEFADCVARAATPTPD